MKTISKIIILILLSISFIKCTVLKSKKINSFNNNVIFIINSKPKLYNQYYVFKFDDKIVNDFKFYHQKYKNFDNKDINLKMLHFKVNKSFLRKNKDIILTEEKIKKMGRNNFLKLLYKQDMVFLIDENMIENNKITIMEMNFGYNAEE